MTEDLDVELSDSLDLVDEAERDVSAKRSALGKARIELANRRKKVAEIQGEIRARVKTGRSSRPLLDGIGSMEAARATFAEETPPKRRTREAAEIGAIAP